MPVIVRDEGGPAPDPSLSLFGFSSPPPAPPTARPTLSTAPVISATPTAGQGIALDDAGKIPVGVPTQSVPLTTADPANPVIGQCWYRQDTSQFCVRHDASTTKRVTLA